MHFTIVDIHHESTGGAVVPFRGACETYIFESFKMTFSDPVLWSSLVRVTPTPHQRNCFTAHGDLHRKSQQVKKKKKAENSWLWGAWPQLIHLQHKPCPRTHEMPQKMGCKYHKSLRTKKLAVRLYHPDMTPWHRCLNKTWEMTLADTAVQVRGRHWAPLLDDELWRVVGTYWQLRWGRFIPPREDPPNWLPNAK